MRQHIFLLVCVCSATFVYISANPLPANDRELDVLQIPLTNGKEIDVLTLGSTSQEQAIAERNKRTIGLLRELFPDITKQIDGIVNRIIAQVIRVAGPSLLPALLGNNRPSTTSRSSFDSDFDDDDDDDDADVKSSNSNDINSNDDSSSNNLPEIGTRVRIDLPTFAPETNETMSSVDNNGESTNATDEARKNGATDTQIDLSAINKQLEETIRVARQVKEAEAAAQAVLALQGQEQQEQQQQQQDQEQQIKHEESIQLSFNNEVLSSNEQNANKQISNDLQLSESKSPAIDDLSLDSNEDHADLDDRNKRFLSFGGGATAGGNGGANGGAGAGSGNFLFDIVRLFSGSVQTQNGDEANSANSVSSSDSDSDATRAADGYTEGIPGPVTRLVVLANRGLANLVQDLILRVAATSEKFVNFKAKLITALI